MSELEQGAIRINAARGLGSLAKQFAAKLGANEDIARGFGEVVREGLHRSGVCKDEELTAVQIAERAGLIRRAKAKRRVRS